MTGMDLSGPLQCVVSDMTAFYLKGVYHDRIEYPKVQQFAVQGEPKAAASQAAPESEQNEIPQDAPSDDHPASDEAVPVEPAPDPDVKGESDSAD